MTYDEEVLADNPKGYWKLNEASGLSAADSSGNNKTMTLINTNGPWLRQPPLYKTLSNRSIYFNGNQQYAFRNYEAYFNFSYVTMECWAYMRPEAGVGFSLSKVESGGYAQYVNAGYIDANIWKNGAYIANAGTAFPTINRPRHMVTTFDGRYVRHYIDGALIFTRDSGASHVLGYGNNVSLMIGANPSGTGSSIQTGNPPQGILSNLAIYDYVLSAARIAAHYAAAKRQVSGSIMESLVAGNFKLFAIDTDGELVGSKTVSGSPAGVSFDLDVFTDKPVYVTAHPDQGDIWQPGTAYAIDDKVLASNTISVPYYYKRLAAGTSGATEPTWTTTPGGRCDDGAVTDAWELVERLSQPITHGPLTPT
ncbi:MAG: hypothetical protein KGZ88_11765 [Methylomicrobium sp.]|nr:hypothetical protein [Methylomicrobium sp.]